MINAEKIKLLDDIPADDRILQVCREYVGDTNQHHHHLLQALPSGAGMENGLATSFGRLEAHCQGNSVSTKPFFSQEKLADFFWEAVADHDTERKVAKLAALLQMWVCADPRNHTRCALFFALLLVGSPNVAISALQSPDFLDEIVSGWSMGEWLDDQFLT